MFHGAHARSAHVSQLNGHHRAGTIVRAVVIFGLGAGVMSVTACASTARYAAPARLTAQSFPETSDLTDATAVGNANSVAPFTRIEVKGGADVVVHEGGTFAVRTMAGTDSRGCSVRGEVVDGTLVIEDAALAAGRARCSVEVTLPTLKRISHAGTGNVHIQGRHGSRVVSLILRGHGNLTYAGNSELVSAAVSNTGHGSMFLTGNAGRLEAITDGTGSIDAGEMTAASGLLGTTGSGDVIASVDGGEAVVEIHGSGDVRLGGTGLPRVNDSGTGRLVRR